jgi:putative membrane protein insertion efficiency factor
VKGIRRALWRALWTVGAPFRVTLIGLIELYRITLAGWLGGQCRFYPSCSRYAAEAVRTHGALRGSLMATWRVARCGPFTEGGVDHVPMGSRAAQTYDDIIRERIHP